MGASYKKKLKQVLDEAEKQEWRQKPKTKGIMLLSPDGVTKVTLHHTASDRSLDNAISKMREGGFRWQGH